MALLRPVALLMLLVLTAATLIGLLLHLGRVERIELTSGLRSQVFRFSMAPAERRVYLGRNIGIHAKRVFDIGASEASIVRGLRGYVLVVSRQKPKSLTFGTPHAIRPGSQSPLITIRRVAPERPPRRP